MNLQNLMGAGGGRSEEPIVRFKAGKCETEARSGGKVWVMPTPRRGEVQLVRVDSLMHFQWRDRTTLAVDASCDHMVFPGDAKFEKIDTGRDDRVYVLQFRENTARRFFFWMQAKDASDDDALVARLNAAMNGDAPAPAPAGQLGNVLRRFQEGAEPSGPGAITLEGLQSVMQNLGMPPQARQQRQPEPASQPVSSEALQRAMTGALPPPLSLADVLAPEAIDASGILEDEAAVARLLDHLPEPQRSRDELRAVARRPQFRQALAQLASALRTPDNFASIFANFGIEPSTTPTPDPVRAFLDAIMHTNQPDAAERDDDGDDKMGDAPPKPDDDDDAAPKTD
ncbi:hypothetical protein CTAYLR_010556 [Chrysophaeum taylorii]|uniref:Uncharacterized protein n=1 Tax=Chrysophaeum taylorii TaxID=2483200 RepID=A0AAD7U6P7_9STRA|nr:hypothetical protein CTAYLR_010556 [Chrysophaeum taylorii]